MGRCRGRRPLATGAVLVAVALVLGFAPTVGTPHLASAAPSAGGSAAGFGAQELTAAEHSLGPSAPPALPVGRGPSGAGAAPTNVPGPAYRWVAAATPTPGPSARAYPAMAWDPVDGYVVLFGGYLASGVPGFDTWSYLNGTWTNLTSEISGHPPSVYAAGFAYDPSDQKMILFGGDIRSGVRTNYTWAYHDLTWTNFTSSSGPAPSQRVLPGMVTDSTAGDIVLVGGFVSGPVGATANDTWTYAGGRWTNVSSAVPLPLRIFDGVTMADDPAADGVLLVTLASESATGDPPLFAATYVYTAAGWQNLTAISPNAPFTAGLFGAPSVGYLPASGAVVVYAAGISNRSGGILFGQFTYEYANGAWTNVTRTAGANVAPLLACGTAVEPYDSALIQFGGENLTTTNETDALVYFAAPPQVTATVSRATSDIGATLAFHGTVAYGVAPVAPAWSFGDGSGAATANATHAYAEPGVYTVNLTATDGVGAIGRASVAVAINPALLVAIVLPPGGATAGSPVGIVGVPSGGTAPYTWSWTLGDGSMGGTSAIVNHTYAAPGAYEITVTVTDAIGHVGGAIATINVSAAPSAPTVSLTSGIGLGLLIAIVALAAVAVVLGVLLARKGRGSRPPPPAYGTPAPSAAPPPPPPPGAPPPP